MTDLQIIIHWLTLNVRASDRLCEWLDSFISSYDQRSAFPELAVAYDLVLEECNETSFFGGAKPGIPLEFSVASAPLFYVDGKLLALEKDLSLEFDLVSHRVNVILGPSYLDEENFLYHFFRDLHHKLLVPFARGVVLHGAVLCKDNYAVFLYGDSGAGKTTTALEFARQGFEMLSDDSPLIANVRGTILALPSLDEISLTQTTLDLYPELQSEVARKREISEKYVLSRHNVSERYAKGVQINQFVFLDRGDYEQPRLHAVPKYTVVSQLVREFMLVFRDQSVRNNPLFSNVSQTMFDIICSLVNNAETSVLQFRDEDVAKTVALVLERRTS